MSDDPTPLTLVPGRGTGSGAAIRERAEGRIPGILYGLDREPTPVSVERADLRHALGADKGRNVLLRIEAGDESCHAVVKELQRHPVRRDVIHVDFQRVTPEQTIVAVVPVAVTGVAREVTTAGGMTEQKLSSVKVKVRADSVPRQLDVDISSMTLGRSLQVKDLEVPDGVTVLTDPLKAVVTSQLTRAALVSQRQASDSGK